MEQTPTGTLCEYTVKPARNDEGFLKNERARRRRTQKKSQADAWLFKTVSAGYGTGRCRCCDQLAERRARAGLEALDASAAAFRVALVAAAKLDSAALAAWRAALAADS